MPTLPLVEEVLVRYRVSGVQRHPDEVRSMIPCLLCGADDHEECGCWEVVYELCASEEDVAFIERGLTNPTEH